MAEKKTRILLRSDIASVWESVNPVLGKGELGVCFDPAVSEVGRRVRVKVGDGVTAWNSLEFIADYDQFEADTQAALAEITASLATKVDTTISSTAGTAKILNKADGGGAKFEHADGSEAFVGVNNGGEDGLMAQIYANKLVDEKWYGAKLDVTNNGMFYTVGDKTFVERAVEANEIATKGDVAGVLPGIDASKYDKYLHTNAITGALEWVYVEQGAANWGSIGGNIEDQIDLMDKFDAIDTELADRYTKDEVYTQTETNAKIAEEIGKIKHWSYKVVDVLPTPSKDCEHIIYLVPKGEGKTGYKEYVCINEGTEASPDWKFEEIGDTDIDLSNYYTKAETDSAISTAVAAEAELRETADEALQGAIEAEASRADTAEKANASAIVAETTRATAAEEANAAAIETEATTARAAEEELATEIAKKADDFDVLDGGSAADWND